MRESAHSLRKDSGLKPKATMLIVGCGYIGQRMAQQLIQNQQAVTGVVRSDASLNTLQQLGVEAIQCDLDQEGLPQQSTQDETLMVCMPPPAVGTDDTRTTQLITGFAHSGQPTRVVYLSTTGVYGDCHGEWVDETWPAKPEVDRAKRRWSAEQQWQAWREQTGGELIILRVAGIYGPDKLPLMRLRKKLPMVSEVDAPWTNRIHADDLVNALLTAAEKGESGSVYNACDGQPGNMTDYFNRVADLAGLERPRIISMDEARTELSDGLLSYLSESRRLSNRKLVEELGVSFKYPTLEEGLPSCF